MGLFHCPVGASYYDDDPCIDCGLCYAKTSAERVEASKKIRAYFRAHAVQTPAPKRIAICGKGGVGKSTVTTLLAQVLREAGSDVLVLDTDESNPGLFRMFGFSRQPKALITIRRPLPGDPPANGEWLNAETISVDNIPPEYMLRENGFRFLMVGKIEDPFQGCACSIAGVARDLMEKLVLEEGQIVIIDMEAGVESFGRGVERYVDTVIAVVEPSYESISLAEKIAFMAQGMGIARVWALLNKIPSQQIEARIARELLTKGVKTAGAVHFNATLSESGLDGKPVAAATATDEMKKVVEAVFAAN